MSVPTPAMFNPFKLTSLPDPPPSLGAMLSCTHPIITREMNNIRKPKEMFNATKHLMPPSLEPTCVDQTLKDKNRRRAMSEEFNALIEHDTWEIIPSQHYIRPVNYKWVFASNANMMVLLIATKPAWCQRAFTSG